MIHRDTVKQATEAVHKLRNEISVASTFVDEIKTGNMDASLEIDRFSGDAQHLAAALVKMRDRFKNLSIQTEQRKWINEGLTRFVDILRAPNHSLSEISDQIIRRVVKY